MPLGAEAPTLTGLLLWMKAESIAIADGADVGSSGNAGPLWTSSEGNNIQLRNRIGSTQPTYETTPNINGVPVLHFTQTGTQNSMCLNPAEGMPASIEAISGTNGGSVYMVGRMNETNPPSGGQGLWTICERDVGFSFQSQVWSTDGHMYDCTFTNAMKDCGVMDLSAPFCYAIFSKTNQYTARLNGAQTFTTGTNTFRASVAQSLLIAAATTGGGAITGKLDVAEFLVYDHVLTAPEIAETEAYLLTKYGL